MTQRDFSGSNRALYVEAWNETMVQIWHDRIVTLGIYESPRRRSRTGEVHLLDSLRMLPVSHDGEYYEVTLSHQFLEYGLYQDRGTGREKYKGNPGDIGATRKDGKPRKYRERRPWFRIKYYASVMNLKEFLAESIGQDFVGILADALQ